MAFRGLKNDRLPRLMVSRWLLTAFALTLFSPVLAQELKKANASAQGPDSSSVSRGQYIVENVAMCGTCHTPRRPDGELDRSRWLAGGPEPYLPAHPDPNWPLQAPRIGGLPPANDAGMIMLLMTAVWIDGKPLRDPMPKFHMSRVDAEAVLAYLKSVGSGK